MLIQPTPIHLNEKTVYKTKDDDLICVTQLLYQLLHIYKIYKIYTIKH